jgi:hypothetical protein
MDVLKKISSLVLFLNITCFLGPRECHAQKDQLASTISPNKRYVIAFEGSKTAPRAVYFLDITNDTNVGWITPPAEAGASNVNVVASWDTSSTKVGLLISYGVKSSTFAIFRQDHVRRFIPVSVDLPNLESLYRRNTNRDNIKPDAAENRLGRWITPNKLALLAGESIITPDGNLTWLFASLELLVGEGSVIKNLQTYTFSSEQKTDNFIAGWQKTYGR